MTMLARLSLAWRVIRGLAGALPAPSRSCARCAELERERTYWRSREERVTNALLATKGITPVAAAPVPVPMNPLAQATRAMQMTEIPSQPGPDAMRGDRD